MLEPYIRNQLLLARDRIQQRLRDRDDTGLATLEVVIIALGLFLLAVALVAAITAAVNSRMRQIR